MQWLAHKGSYRKYRYLQIKITLLFDLYNYGWCRPQRRRSRVC